VIGTATIRPF